MRPLRTFLAVLAAAVTILSLAVAAGTGAGEVNFAQPAFKAASPSQIKATTQPAAEIIRRIPE